MPIQAGFDHLSRRPGDIRTPTLEPRHTRAATRVAPPEIRVVRPANQKEPHHA